MPPIVFVDMRARNLESFKSLRDRAFVLIQRGQNNSGMLEPQLMDELDTIIQTLTRMNLQAHAAQQFAQANPQRAAKAAGPAQQQGNPPTITLDHARRILQGLIAPVGLVDPFFDAVRNSLLQITGQRVGDPVDGKLPSQVINNQQAANPQLAANANQPKIPPDVDLTADEKALAAVYGLMEADNFTNPSLSRFTAGVTNALGEYTRNKLLYDIVLGVLKIAGAQVNQAGQTDSYEIDASQWAAVARNLLKDGVTAGDRLLRTKVLSALENFISSDGSAPPSSTRIGVPDFEEVTAVDIIGDNLEGMLGTYFAMNMEDMGLWHVVDQVAYDFQVGQLPMTRSRAGDFLYHYLKTTAERMSEVERRNLYARAFGSTGGEPNQGMLNREFPNLWLRFVASVSSFARQLSLNDLLRANIPAGVSQQTVMNSARNLAANLSLHGYGITYFAATELQNTIKDFVNLLSDQDMLRCYGSRDLFSLIETVSTVELGKTPNVIKYRTMANSGAVIIRWLSLKARDLSGSLSYQILDEDEIRHPMPRPVGVKAADAPRDSDLVNACNSWLSVTGTGPDQAEEFTNPEETPVMTSQPIPLPSVARDMLESVGIRSNGNGKS